MRRFNYSLIGILGALVVGSLPTRADQPGWEIKNFLDSMILVVRIYRIQESQLGVFLDTAVSMGPFTSKFGGFANEKILEPISGPNGNEIDVIMVSRFFDAGTPDLVNKQRDAALRRLSQSEPIAVSATLVENTFGDWSWEGDAISRTEDFQIATARPYESEQILMNERLSVSFGKGGYVGQVGMLESFAPDTQMESIRRELSSRSDIAGASIFRADSGYVVYSEYFRTSEDLANRRVSVANVEPGGGGAWFTGGQLGIVTTNYSNR